MNRISPYIHLSSWQRTVLSVFVAALLIRGLFILTLKDGFYFYDSVDYSTAAVNLAANGEFGAAYKRPPVYPLFLAGIYALFGENIGAIRIVQALMGACLAVVVALVARRLGGDGVGALAGILWSIYPLGVFIAGLVYPTSVATLLLACAVLCMLTKTDQELGPRRVVLGGILYGFAALTKPVALVTIVATTLWITYWRRARTALDSRFFFSWGSLFHLPHGPSATWTFTVD